MDPKPFVRIIKKERRRRPEIQAGLKFDVGPNKWSRVVQLWVSEFQQHRRDESFPAFDNLLKAPESQVRRLKPL